MHWNSLQLLQAYSSRAGLDGMVTINNSAPTHTAMLVIKKTDEKEKIEKKKT
jgi:hypothetical protein